MLRTIQLARRTTLPATLSRRGMATEIPIGSVARLFRMHVADENAAIKADAIVETIKADLASAGLPGYVKTVRTVCKAEWAYEGALVFDSLDNFKNYMGSSIRASHNRL